MGHQQHGRAPRQQHRREGLLRVVSDVLVQPGVGGVGELHDQDGVAIGRRAGHFLGADHGAGAWLVVDDHRLLPVVAQVLGREPAQRVIEAAGRIGHDDAHRLGRVLLRLGGADAEGGEDCKHLQRFAGGREHEVVSVV